MGFCTIVGRQSDRASEVTCVGSTYAWRNLGEIMFDDSLQYRRDRFRAASKLPTVLGLDIDESTGEEYG